MTLKAVKIRPGTNRENTRYTNEGQWYESEKVRFRQGTPEKIGGWVAISANTFLGVCRSLWNWITLSGLNLMGVGTNLKFYLERGGSYDDITPIRVTTAAGAATFAATDGSTTVTVTDTAHGATDNTYVTFSGAVSLGGVITAAVLNIEYQIHVLSVDTYTITTSVAANASDTGNGGASVVVAYQVSAGSAVATPSVGWGAGAWGSGTWSVGAASTSTMRLWNQQNFGEDLIFGPAGGALYYWDATGGVTTRGTALTAAGGASNVPTIHQILLVSDIQRFVIVFGTNEIGSAVLDPLLIRWSDQESAVNWTPAITNQAGDIRVSHGSKLVTAIATRQEILVLTDAAVYSMQYSGPPGVWGLTLLGDNISVMSQRCIATASGAVYWMGRDKFYKYDGRVQTLRCDLRQFIFLDLDIIQAEQVFATTNEAFNEIWWFYPSLGSTTVDMYAVYNYQEDIWYYGTMARTAWIDTALRANPVAATYINNLVSHEYGVDDYSTAVGAAIEAYIGSSEFDIDDGDHFMFIYRVLPDITFTGSTAASPSATLTLIPMVNSGSGYTTPASLGGSSTASITRSATVPIEAFTGQVYVRVRGRQLILKLSSDALGTTWQMGTPRLDVRPDGRAGS